ncbi:phage tail spike protein [Cytobacillus firmus]|uniref:Putative minor structural protein n=1 Tax=Cytobacillus firmus DS1 TaxID=1307436 RepID=W7L986_CYTFI|nr:phage tail spike protein [Cytobacillus firmus]EWG08364.1 putative minor structural protein [Cytobacillus firmus DS1]
MLVVTDLSGRTEALTDIKGTEVNEEVNGDFSMSFTSVYTDNNAHSYPLLTEEAIVDFEGHEFRIKGLSEDRFRKAVKAPHIYFDLIDHQIYEINGGTKTIQEFFQIALAGSGWTFEILGQFGSKLIPNFGEDNAVSLIKLICDVFECERKIEPGKHLKIYKEVGKDNDEQFRYKHNVKTLKKNVDTSKLATIIKGYGGNGLEVIYTSPNVSRYGERHAEPVRDERFTVAESLIERCRQELIDVPEITFDLEVTQLGFDADLGDKVWTIYEPMDIEFQQRVMAKKWFPFTNRTPVVTLSNKKQSFVDLLTETNIKINENQKQVRSNIEQTNERITLEVTSIDGKFAETEARIEITEGQIQSKVSYSDYTGNTITSLITQDAYSISFLAQQLNLQGLVTFENLDTPGQTVIDGGNLKTNSVAAEKFYGNVFNVGNGVTSTNLKLTTSDSDVHQIISNQAMGFLIASSGSMRLRSNSGNGIYTSGGPFVMESGMRVDGGVADFNVHVDANSLNAGSLTLGGLNVATQNWVANLLPSDPVSWYNTYNIRRGGAGIKFLYGSSTVQARNYWDDAYGTFEGLAYSNVSRREEKKDIEPFGQSALRLISETPVYSYRYNSDLDSEPKRVGLIYDEAPMEIMQFTGGIDVYGMGSLMWKAIQELNYELNLLKGAA